MGEKKVYFVSGIDTDAGKSYVTGELARRWRAEGIRVITQKFIQTGCVDQATGARRTVSEDIELHRKIMGCGLLPEDIDQTTCPICLSYPASPDMAARMDGVTIDTGIISAATAKLLEKYDTVILEGAGGLMVPIAGEFTTKDYILQHNLPVILVTSGRLGSINHTLLSLEACERRGIEVAALAYNNYPEIASELADDTRRYFKKYIAKHHPEAQFIEIPIIKI